MAIISYALIAVLATCSAVCAQDGGVADTAAAKALFVYDKLDKESKFFVESFRTKLKETGVAFDEAAVAGPSSPDMSVYDYLVVYSRVMGFNMMKPVHKWVKSINDFGGKKINLFVTANRWFAEGHFKELKKLITDRNGDIVDAVSMATSKMSSKEKIVHVGKHLVKLEK